MLQAHEEALLYTNLSILNKMKQKVKCGLVFI